MGYLVTAFIIVWFALFGYLGWIALRLRGARAELSGVRELLREREKPGQEN
jgi:CcmD family protein